MVNAINQVPLAEFAGSLTVENSRVHNFESENEALELYPLLRSAAGLSYPGLDGGALLRQLEPRAPRIKRFILGAEAKPPGQRAALDPP